MSYSKKTLNRKVTGKNIFNIITLSDYTFEEVAFILELNSPRVIYEWVKGNKMPSLENFYNLIILLNAKLEDVLAFA